MIFVIVFQDSMGQVLGHAIYEHWVDDPEHQLIDEELYTTKAIHLINSSQVYFEMFDGEFQIFILKKSLVPNNCYDWAVHEWNKGLFNISVQLLNIAGPTEETLYRNLYYAFCESVYDRSNNSKNKANNKIIIADICNFLRVCHTSSGVWLESVDAVPQTSQPKSEPTLYALLLAWVRFCLYMVLFK